ncbi:hypothetical protein V1506DRAFT_539728 [Lipomyces tetrasporus]
MTANAFDDASTSVWGDQPLSDLTSGSTPSLPQSTLATTSSSSSTTMTPPESPRRELPPLPQVIQPRANIEHYVPATLENELSIDQLHEKIYVQTPSTTAPSALLASSSSSSSSLIPTCLEDTLGLEKTSALRREAKLMQDGLAAILERILEVKGEYERLEDENKFLQDYIGNLMSRSKMLTTKTSD